MSEKSENRNAALRTLHEVWNVPFDLIAQAAGLSASSIAKSARVDGWVSGPSPARLQAQLMEAYGQSLERFTQAETDIDEKQARALAALAKVLESIATVAGRIAVLNADQQQGTSKSPIKQSASHDTSGESEADRSARLDRELARLVEGLA